MNGTLPLVQRTFCTIREPAVLRGTKSIAYQRSIGRSSIIPGSLEVGRLGWGLINRATLRRRGVCSVEIKRTIQQQALLRLMRSVSRRIDLHGETRGG